MTLTTPVKAASGLALTSAGAAGVAIGYKYVTDLYEVEKEAIKADAWTVGPISIPASGSGSEKTIPVTVTFSKNGDGSQTRTWTCKLIAVTNDNTATSEGIKEDLKNYFGDINDSSSTTTTKEKPNEKQRKGFVTSCSRNRTKGEQTHNQVTSELRLSITKLQDDQKYKFNKEDLKKVFEGNWTNTK